MQDMLCGECHIVDREGKKISLQELSVMELATDLDPNHREDVKNTGFIASHLWVRTRLLLTFST